MTTPRLNRDHYAYQLARELNVPLTTAREGFRSWGLPNVALRPGAPLRDIFFRTHNVAALYVDDDNDGRPMAVLDPYPPNRPPPLLVLQLPAA